MSKFNKIYEYEYFLFGQVSKTGEILPDFSECQFLNASVIFFFFFLECDSDHDIRIGSLTGSGV